jgi:hypothetical protein
MDRCCHLSLVSRKSVYIVSFHHRQRSSSITLTHHMCEVAVQVHNTECFLCAMLQVNHSLRYCQFGVDFSDDFQEAFELSNVM